MTDEKESMASGNGAVPPENADAETPTNGGGDENAANAPALAINAQYIKDLSFEAPATPQIFKEVAESAAEHLRSCGCQS